MTGKADTAIDRRSVLAGVASAGLLGSISGIAHARAPDSKAFDVVVVGGGSAGLPLAITAATRGARVLVIEKSDRLGGTLHKSIYCSTAAAGTSFQKAAGIVDSPQAHYEDVLRATGTVADPALVRLWTENGAAMVDWLVAQGVKFRFRDSRPVAAGATYRAPRIQFPVGGGAAVVQALQPAFDRWVAAGRIVVRFGARAVELTHDGKGAVNGVAVQEKGQAGPVGYEARNVVLTAGGSQGNPMLYEALLGRPLAAKAWTPEDTGDGLLLGLSMGGHLRGAEHYVPMFGIVMSDDLQPSTALDGTLTETMLNPDVKARGGWEIWVNAHGERFFAEDSGVPQARERALGKQPGHRFWTIHDQAALDGGSVQMAMWDKAKYVSQFGKAALFYKADNIERLAFDAGLDPAAVRRSVEAYNAAVKAGSPDPFGRANRAAPIEKGPFYAVRYQGWHLLTFPGLTVDGSLRVVRRDGRPVPNLYAAGEVLGAAALGASADAHGSMGTPALTFGKLLGERILRF